MKTIAGVLILSLLSGCATEEGNNRLKAGLLIAAIGATAYALSRGGGGSGGYYAPPTTDYDWAWDYQNAPNGLTMWVCRGMQTGQYAEKEHCAYKPMIDNQWPGI